MAEESPDGETSVEDAEPGDDPTSEPEAPRPWRTWPWWVGGLGRVLLTLGVLTLLFAAYQLWGTGVTHARAQAGLEDEFAERREQALATTPATVAPTTTRATRPTSTAPSTTGAPARTTLAATTGAPTTVTPTTVVPASAPPSIEAIEQGDGIARIVIPGIEVDEIVVAGVSRKDLQRGPGHYPDTPLPGQLGNVAIAGHRTTYGAPFARLDELKAGDVIELSTYTGEFRYIVSEQLIVNPSATYVVGPTPDAILTLTTCHPKYSARKRLVIKAILDAPESSPPAPPTPNAYDTEGAPPDEQDAVGDAPPDTTTADEEAPTSAAGAGEPETATTSATPAPTPVAVDALGEGWFSDSSAWVPTALWAAFGLLYAGGVWWLGRRWRRWTAYGLGSLPLLLIVYFFFENLNRLLPPSI